MQPSGPSQQLEPGLHRLALGEARDGVLYVPDAAGSRPLLVMLHGATMRGEQMARPLLSAADDMGVVLLLPDSRAETWDVLLGGYGPDVAFIDDAMRQTFDRCAIDFDAVHVGGVSDGASYALSLGIANASLFRRIVAFSPGFAAPPEISGQPAVFISHGIHDRILPIDACGRPIAAGLHNSGFEVEYVEFDGGHEIPDPVVRQAFRWLVAAG